MASNIITLNVACRSAGKIFRLKAITIPPILPLSSTASEPYREPVKALRRIGRIGTGTVVPDPELRGGWQIPAADHQGVIAGRRMPGRLRRQCDRHEHFARVGKGDREIIRTVEPLALPRAPVHQTPLDNVLNQSLVDVRDRNLQIAILR